MLRPPAGQLRVLGCDAWRARERILDSVGVVPEEPSAPGWASARRLAAFRRSVYTRWDDAGYAARLARFGVPLDMPFESLSRGQRGATMLALALGHAPELLVLDDPTLGLDAVARRFVFEELIGELADRGVSVFMASHDLAGVEAVADRIGVLAGGRIKVEGDLAELKERAGCSLEELFLGTLASTPEVAA
jgi:ABC-2 type transport system ATP-binding protein